MSRERGIQHSWTQKFGRSTNERYDLFLSDFQCFIFVVFGHYLDFVAFAAVVLRPASDQRHKARIVIFISQNYIFMWE